MRGRSGRQGDPGVSQIYVSLDDYIVKRWSNSKLAENKKLKDVDPDKLQDSPFFRRRVRGIVSKAQRVSEETSMMAREMANELKKVSAFNVIVCMKSAIVFLKRQTSVHLTLIH